ncbi:ankyrin repeat-containing protein BDA1 [Ziziphus jujuba]|uniref:Ankyrin repeat-containing protein BDA1 n=1 Tax=Ziziphus jujuba TaxID=326968 RepID=A0ABM3IL81_ZIZJJ|nr:ankyrin repeat-containing protein BDA1 [Ziziphus jujuba]
MGSRSVDELYGSIESDPYTLERIDQVPFPNTPLHKAASDGDVPLVKELMILKPSFAGKINKDGHTPMHLALKNDKNNLGVVRALLESEPSLLGVQGREGETPLHILAKKFEKGEGDVEAGQNPSPYLAKNKEDQKQRLELLDEIVSSENFFRHSIQVKTTKGKTALHIAVENENVDAVDILVGGLRTATWEGSEAQEWEIINRKDGEGNTALHNATTKNQLQVVRILLENTKIEVNAKDSRGRTALDISIDNGYSEVKDILRAAGAKTACSLPKGSRSKNQLQSKVPLTEQFAIYFGRLRNNTKNESRKLLLAVAPMVAAVAYQAAPTPPGGVWQDNDDNTATTSNKVAHRAGRAIMGIKPFSVLYFCNTVTLFAATIIILVLLPKGQIRNLLSGLLFLYLLGYVLSLEVIWPSRSTR